MAAGRVLIVIVVALATAMLLDSRGMVHTGEAMPPGGGRDFVLGIAHPIDSIAHALRLDWPHQRFDKLLGRDQYTGPSDLTRTSVDVDNRPVLGPNAQSASPASPSVAALRPVSAAAPLRLLFTGDSMMLGIGPQAVNLATGIKSINVTQEAHPSTGLVVPQFFDWSLYAMKIDRDNPDAVVIIIGGNDGQGISVPNGALQAGTEEWAVEYRRRATVVMRILSHDGTRPVYWLSMPPTRNDEVPTRFMQVLNAATQQAAEQVPGVRWINLYGAYAVNGGFSDELPDGHGGSYLARTSDGVHFTYKGGEVAARLALAAVDRDWHYTAQAAAPPAPPGGGGAGAPAAGAPGSDAPPAGGPAVHAPPG